MDENNVELFQKAAKYAKSRIGSMSSDQILKLYGLYKQALEGPNQSPKPNFWNITNKSKWDAWSANGTKTKECAMEEYISLINDFDPDWNDKEIEDQFWVSHSTMTNDEEAIPDSEKTIFDWVKESNLEKVKENFNKEVLSDSDDDGLFLIHWAADRGDVKIVEFLIRNEADLNVQDGDGQLALHYASSCGHIDVVKALIKAGANINKTDTDGQTPCDVATNPYIVQIFNS